ncbi:MAG TPA: MOSC domain-containing protein [Solirubrobacteraceae bacterium]|nr:MOSC domain-containing protein [Solirubrobacteraceae bacterium]
MRTDQPAPADGPPLSRSVAACLGAILEVSVTDVPVPAGPDPWTVWRGWLGTRALGLVEVRAPAAFNWAGPWIALLGGDRAGEPVAALAFGSPPGIVWRPLGGDAPFEAVVAGYAVAPHDVALWAPAATAAPPTVGRVELVAIAPAATAPMRVVDRAAARAGRGLEGDRYFAQDGTFWGPAATGVDLTLVAAEALDALILPSGNRLAYADARRNLVTRGIDLNALVGRRFRVGDVECLGQRLCEPCAHLERLTEPGTLRGLLHRGGLRADVLSDGEIAVGDDVRALD